MDGDLIRTSLDVSAWIGTGMSWDNELKTTNFKGKIS